ncbi:hypothetical protein DXG03_009196 [Asterophora parasitica]|uniref:GPI anchored protein n=1 Tax=Asterophora parasitica TaxID=117018 RepID=A0A9P7G6Y2_9AGAR|nr:hypothetical protein DXG03_009196 [Asterophora parasitica]
MLSVPLTFVAVFAGSALAQTSLFIPGFDPQPISADILGVDGQGRTTWALHQGAVTNSAQEGSFPGTGKSNNLVGPLATLVEGANDVSFTYVPPNNAFTLGQQCSLSGGLAICSATISGQVVTETETANPILVQVGTTAPLSTATGTAAASTATGTPSRASESRVSATGPAQTSERTSSAASPTKTSNKGNTLVPLISGLFISAASVAFVLQL